MNIQLLVVLFSLFFGSTLCAAATDPCAAPLPTATEALTAIRAAATNDVPEIIPATKILPAGASADFVVQRDFDSQTTYRAVIDGKSVALLAGSQINIRRIPSEYPLAKDGIAAATSTLVTMQIPAALGSAWAEATIYVFGCKAAQSGPTFVATATMPVSNSLFSVAIIWSALIATYLLIAIASKLVDKQRLPWFRYLDPVLLTAGSNGKGDLAKLQILFFSMIVAGLVGYIVSRTGILSNLSSTVLLLLGIAGIGSAAAKATDVSRSRLDFDNWAWFIRKGWLPEGGLAAVNDARWRDLVTTDGEFDVYHFQNLIFSLVVGGALLVVGLRDLATFSIPDTLLGVLGLSQVVYVGGKLVAPPTFAELNTATTALRQLEKDFVATATSTPDPSLPDPREPPDDLDASIRRAGRAKYDAYMDRAKSVRIIFQAVTGQPVDEQRLGPAFAF